LKQRFFKIKFRVNRVHSLLINASLLKGYFLLQLTTKPSTVLLRKKQGLYGSVRGRFPPGKRDIFLVGGGNYPGESLTIS